MSFLKDLGDRFAGRDAWSQTELDIKKKQSELLDSLINEKSAEEQQVDNSNTFLIVTVAGVLATAGVITYLVMKKKR